MSEYSELTPETVTPYFSEVVLPHLPEGSKVVSSREVTELTQVNWIYEVDVQSPGGELESLFLKQSRNTVKKYEDLTRPASRIDAEARTLAFLPTVVPDFVPGVVYYDSENHILSMRDIKRGGQILFDELRAGRAHPDAATYLGDAIARIQVATLGKTREEILGEGVEPIANPSTEGYLGFRAIPALELYSELAREIMSEVDRGPKAFILGDPSSRNTVVDGHRARLMDFERTSVGDLSIDPSYLFAHYLVEIPAERIDESVTAISNFMDTYKAKLAERFSPAELGRLQNRIVRMLGVMLLHRTQGKYFVIDVDADKELWQERAATLVGDTSSFSVVSSMKAALTISK